MTRRTYSLAAALLALSFTAIRAQDDAKPPVLRYDGERRSERWIEVGERRVAIDKGIAWRGSVAYLSLTQDLIVTDEKTGAVRWSVKVTEAWTGLTFAEVDDGTKKVWAVELLPAAGDGGREHYALEHGARIKDAPSGKRLDGLKEWSGAKTDDGRATMLLIDSADDWRSAVAEPFFKKVECPIDPSSIDWKESFVLVVLLGDRVNCNGLRFVVYEDDARFLVRLRPRTFQTMSTTAGGGLQHHRPWGAVLLPRRTAGKPLIIEKNTQRLIGGPEIWVEEKRFTETPASAPAKPK